MVSGAEKSDQSDLSDMSDESSHPMTKEEAMLTQIEISLEDEAKSKEIEQRLAEERRAREEVKTWLRHEELRRKREEERKTQPDLFDVGD